MTEAVCKGAEAVSKGLNGSVRGLNGSVRGLKPSVRGLKGTVRGLADSASTQQAGRRVTHLTTMTSTSSWESSGFHTCSHNCSTSQPTH